MLSDQDIGNYVRSEAPLVDGIDTTDQSKSAPIQSASIDLTAGKIFRPYSKGFLDNYTSEAGQAHREYILAPGETVVVQTKEYLRMPRDLGGIVFAPSNKSSAGLLMVNTGHVDPGYRGYLHMTVINVGKKSISVRQGDRLVSLMLFQLSSHASRDWLERRGGAVSPSSEQDFIKEVQSSLSRDFLNVTERSRAAATNAIAKVGLKSMLLPLGIALVGAWATAQFTTSQKFAELEAKVNAIGSEVDLGAIDDRIDQLENKIDDK